MTQYISLGFTAHLMRTNGSLPRVLMVSNDGWLFGRAVFRVVCRGFFEIVLDAFHGSSIIFFLCSWYDVPADLFHLLHTVGTENDGGAFLRSR